MIPIPAIDLKNEKVVRLLRGNFDEEKIYSDDAAKTAKHFEDSGAQRIHIIDLDGALKGKPRNLKSIEAILGAVQVPVELGGGIRTLKQAERYLRMGIRWVIFGTQACLDAGFVREALAGFGEKAIIGIDALGGLIATDGWTKIRSERAVDLVKRLETLGVQTVIYTDIAKDGTLTGPNLTEIENICRSVSIDVIASGGVRSTQDLGDLARLGQKNILGVIIGKALYENRFTLEEAAKACLQNG